MKLVCKCLNFVIEADENVQSLDVAVKNKLSPRAPHSEELVIVKCESIIKRIDILVGISGNDEWTEYICRNCNVWMYSCPTSGQEDLDSMCVVDKSTMINPADYEDLMEHSNYSPIFKILIFDQAVSDMYSGSREPLHPIASAWLEQQAVLAESRIKTFADQQYADLENKRMRAHSEQVALKRALSSDELRQKRTEGSIQPLAVKPSGVTPAINIAAKENAPPNIIDLDLDMDESIMFESKHSQDSMLSEGSDDEGIDPQSRRMSEPMVARSLPIPVPLFLEDRRYDDRHEKSPQTPIDIAANMRALARSAHGNPIFGELPRPRFTKD